MDHAIGACGTLLPNPSETGGTGLQVRDPDHVVVDHSIGNVLGTGHRQREAAVLTAMRRVAANHIFQPVHILARISRILEIGDLSATRPGSFAHRRRQFRQPLLQLLPEPYLGCGTGHRVLPGRGGGWHIVFSGLLGDCLESPIKCPQAGFYTPTRGPHRGLIALAGKRQRRRCCQCAEQTSRDHAAGINCDLLHVQRDVTFGYGAAGGQHRRGVRDAVTWNSLLGHRKHPVGGSDQGGVGAHQSTHHRPPRLHQFGSNQNIDISG